MSVRVTNLGKRPHIFLIITITLYPINLKVFAVFFYKLVLLLLINHLLLLPQFNDNF